MHDERGASIEWMGAIKCGAVFSSEDERDNEASGAIKGGGH